MSAPPLPLSLPSLEMFRLDIERQMRHELESIYSERIADFTRAATALEEFEDAENPPRERQFFLAEGIRLSAGVAPRLYALADTALRHLGIDRPVEFYIYRTDRPDAFCSYDRERAIFSVCVAPEYINMLEELELLDLLGHEIGHAVLDHVQNKFLMAEDLYLDIEDWEASMRHSVLGKHEKRQLQKARDTLAMLDHSFLARCRRLARLQELSADRIGLLCSRDLGATLVSHMKELTGGLSSKFICYDASAIINQLDELDALDRHAIDLFDGTHPITAVRMKSLMIFEQSETYARAIGRASFAHPGHEADAMVDDLLRRTERFPSKPSDRTLISAVTAGALLILEPAGTDGLHAAFESGLYSLLEYSEIPSDWVVIDPRGASDLARESCASLVATMPESEREDALRMALQLAHKAGKPSPRSRGRVHQMATYLSLPSRAADKALQEAHRPPGTDRRNGRRHRFSRRGRR